VYVIISPATPQALTTTVPAAPLEELVYYATKSQQVAILSSAATAELANAAASKCGLKHVAILPHLPMRELLRPLDMTISSDPPRDARSPGVVIFTSGTTGKPKGVVLRRTYTHEAALAIGDGYDISASDVVLHTLPVHHTTGLGTTFFPFLNAGACIEFHGKFDAKTVMDRWLQGGLTVFSAVPTIYQRLKWFIEKLPQRQQIPYRQASRQFRAFLCGSSALQENVQEYWSSIRETPILTRYGATEIPGCLRVPYDRTSTPKGSVGLPVPGVELKISPQGELLVKSPNMFAK
jgi:malonyl-CoA/methylmalonyl-CoA synthetase